MWCAHGSGHIRLRHPLKPACQIARLHETPVASLGHSKRILEIRLGDIFAASVDGTFSAIFSSRGQGWLSRCSVLHSVDAAIWKNAQAESVQSHDILYRLLSGHPLHSRGA
jgi:hypothetical protein